MHGVASPTTRNLISQLQKSYLNQNNFVHSVYSLAHPQLTVIQLAQAGQRRNTKPTAILHLRRAPFATAQEGENIASTSPCPLLPSLVPLSCRRSYSCRFWMDAPDSDSDTQLGQRFLVLLYIPERRRSIMFRLFLMTSTSPSLYPCLARRVRPRAKKICERLCSLASEQMRLLRTWRMSREAVFSVWRKRVHIISTSPAPYVLEYFDWFDYPLTEERLKVFKCRIFEVLAHLLEYVFAS